MFGATSTWGNNQQNQQQNQTPNAFGQPSAFGATNTTNAFGSTNAFGQPAAQAQPTANPMFGNLTTPSTNTTTGFGTFGGGTTGAATSAFGASKPATGFGAFGGTTGAFGGGTTGAFGQPAAAPATSAFGQPAAATSAFGSTSAFGAKPFGAAATPGTANPVVTTGTSNPPFTTTSEKDNNSTLQYQSISAMPAYIGYSFEELRVQDYAQNRKTATTTTGAFGQTTFGAQPAATTNLFGQPAQQAPPSIFGATPSTNTATTGFGGFGQPAAQPAAPASNLFGGGTFGQTAQQPAATNAFGSTTGAFGQPAQQPATNAFGTPGAFGAAANKPAFGGFGTGATTGTNAFGSTSTTPAFGAQPQQPAAPATNIFGQAQPAATGTTTGFGGFGATAAKPSIFGASTATPAANANPFGGFGTNTQQQQQPQQGQQANPFGGGATTNLFGGGQQQQNQQGTTTNLFGATQPAATNTTTATPSLFGNTNTTTGLFGNTQQQNQQQQQGQQQQTNSLFGNMFKPAQPATNTTNLFGGATLGQPAATTTQPTNNLFGGFGQTNTGLFGNKPAAPLLGTTMSGTQNTTNNLFGGSTLAGSQGPQLTASINQPIGENLPLFAMLPPGPRLLNPEVESTKRRPGNFFEVPTRSPLPPRVVNNAYNPAASRLRGFGSSLAASTAGGNGLNFSTGRPNALSMSKGDLLSQSASLGPDFLNRSSSPSLGSGNRHSVKKVILDKKIEPTEVFAKTKTGSPGLRTGGKIVFSPALSAAARERDTAAPAPAPSVVDTPTPAHRSLPARSPSHANVQAAEPAAAPAQEKEATSTELVEGDYYMKPDLTTLKKASYEELSSFSGLVVGRKGYGEIHFLEPVDLTGLPKLGALLGEVIKFDDKECTVYADIDDADKPLPGSGLNVKARMMLEHCWTMDKATREPITDPAHPNSVKHLKRLKAMKDTHFEDFDFKTGTWTFSVDHF